MNEFDGNLGFCVHGSLFIQETRLQSLKQSMLEQTADSFKKSRLESPRPSNRCFLSASSATRSYISRFSPFPDFIPKTLRNAYLTFSYIQLRSVTYFNLRSVTYIQFTVTYVQLRYVASSYIQLR